MDSELNAILAQKDKFESGKAASEEKIQEAEHTLRLTFANEYREYLRKYGNVSFLGHILTGISQYLGIDVVTVTEETRRLNNSSHDSNLYVIEETHIDGIIIWQDETGSIYQTAPGSRPVKIYNNLREYIHSL